MVARKITLPKLICNGWLGIEVAAGSGLARAVSTILYKSSERWALPFPYTVPAGMRREVLSNVSVP